MRRASWLFVVVLPCCWGPHAAGADDAAQVRLVKNPQTEVRGTLYTFNREPLVPALLARLPVGSVVPRGWLRRQLELQAAGMHGQLAEISHFLKWEGNGWADPEGRGGWEELPYWLKGYGDLGYVLGDEKIIAAARKWLDAILAAQQPDGWFGPRPLRTSFKGRPDMWPHMPILNALQSYYEFSGDRRVPEFMLKYCALAKRAAGRLVRRRLLAADAVRRQPGDRLLAVQPHGRGLAAGPGPQDPRAHGRLDHRRAQLAQREHRPVFSRAGRILACRPATQNSSTASESRLSKGDGACTASSPAAGSPATRTAGPATAIRGRASRRAASSSSCTVSRCWPASRAIRCGLDRCEDIAFNTLPAALTPDLQGPALSDRSEHGAVGPQEQGARLAERRHDAFLQPARLSLLPAQSRHGLALLCRGIVAGHRRQRPVRVALRRLGSDRQGGRRRRDPRSSRRPIIRSATRSPCG